MMSRAEIVDILIYAHMPEAVAWKIAVALGPDYLEAMDKAAVCRDTDELLSEYLKRARETAELCGFHVNRGESPL